MSKTRLMLDSSGRGIYRDLLDMCYGQGSIPKDPALQAAHCGCTVAEIERVWPLISRHFVQDKNDPESLRNKVADTFRKSFFSYCNQQRKNRKKTIPSKSRDNNDLSNDGQTV